MLPSPPARQHVGCARTRPSGASKRPLAVASAPSYRAGGPSAARLTWIAAVAALVAPAAAHSAASSAWLRAMLVVRCTAATLPSIEESREASCTRPPLVAIAVMHSGAADAADAAMAAATAAAAAAARPPFCRHSSPHAFFELVVPHPAEGDLGTPAHWQHHRFLASTMLHA